MAANMQMTNIDLTNITMWDPFPVGPAPAFNHKHTNSLVYAVSSAHASVSFAALSPRFGNAARFLSYDQFFDDIRRVRVHPDSAVAAAAAMHLTLPVPVRAALEWDALSMRQQAAVLLDLPVDGLDSGGLFDNALLDSDLIDTLFDNSAPPDNSNNDGPPMDEDITGNIGNIGNIDDAMLVDSDDVADIVDDIFDSMMNNDYNDSAAIGGSYFSH